MSNEQVLNHLLCNFMHNPKITDRHLFIFLENNFSIKPKINFFFNFLNFTLMNLALNEFVHFKEITLMKLFYLIQRIT